MFEGLVEVASGVRDALAVGAWARVENAACARRLSAAADVLDRLYAAGDSDDRDQWIEDNWSAVAAEIAPNQNVSAGMVAAQLGVAVALRDRLPKVNAVFMSGALTYRMVAAIVSRTWLITDPRALAEVDAAIAAHVAQWTTLSVQRQQAAIDYWVDRIDPAAVRRAESTSRDRYLDVRNPKDGSGVAYLEGVLYSYDADLIDARLEAMATAVCADDPRTLDQRRSDAMTAVFSGAQSLPCACGSDDCQAAGTRAGSVVVHVVAHADTLEDATPVRLDGPHPPEPADEDASTTAFTPGAAPVSPDAGSPGYVIGNRAVLPASVVAVKLATARRRPIIHPGDSPPENRRTPSAALAWFVRCRDLTCRFPGCSKPATDSDLDHTIPYPRGATQATNLKCLCRRHHLLKTFWGWRDHQHPDGTVDWLSPGGQAYTTHPGSRLLFPSLCRPTAPAVIDDSVEIVDDAVRCLKMPRRKQTRAQNRAKAIAEERRRNQPRVDERNQPPPF